MTANQCDTIFYPELTFSQDNNGLEVIPTFQSMGFFQNDTLLHPEIVVHPIGIPVNTLPYRLWRDDWVTGTLLICFFILAFYIHFNGKRLLVQSQQFFYSRRHGSGERIVQTTMENQSVLFIVFILCLIGGIVFFEYAQFHQGLFLVDLLPYILLGLYIGSWIVYFLFKHLLYSFINWIFFDKDEILLWKDSMNFLISAESVLLFTIMVVSVYFSLSPQNTVFAVFIAVLVTKLLCLYKTKQIFFGKMYGNLYLFVYFCTLELVPLLAIVKFLMWITTDFIVNF